MFESPLELYSRYLQLGSIDPAHTFVSLFRSDCGDILHFIHAKPNGSFRQQIHDHLS